MVDAVLKEKLDIAKTKGLNAVQTFLHTFDSDYFLEPITSQTLAKILMGGFKNLDEVRNFDSKIIGERNIELLLREIEAEHLVERKVIIESIFTN